jgi:hypothetical protein
MGKYLTALKKNVIPFCSERRFHRSRHESIDFISAITDISWIPLKYCQSPFRGDASAISSPRQLASSSSRLNCLEMLPPLITDFDAFNTFRQIRPRHMSRA